MSLTIIANKVRNCPRSQMEKIEGIYDLKKIYKLYTLSYNPFDIWDGTLVLPYCVHIIFYKRNWF